MIARSAQVALGAGLRPRSAQVSDLAVSPTAGLPKLAVTLTTGVQSRGRLETFGRTQGGVGDPRPALGAGLPGLAVTITTGVQSRGRLETFGRTQGGVGDWADKISYDVVVRWNSFGCVQRKLLTLSPVLRGEGQGEGRLAVSTVLPWE